MIVDSRIIYGKIYILNNQIITKIGIPRAMSYYNNYPFYQGFFSGLGIEIVLSDKTTTAIINDGCKYVVSDTCLPVKVFVGHVVNLLDKGCEVIFVPSLQSTGHKINHCSKVRGLPEIIRNVVNRQFKMIEPTLDKTEGLGLREFCIDIANQLGIFNDDLVDIAMKQGWEKYDKFVQMAKSGIPYHEALKNAIENRYDLKNIEVVKPISVAIMGHGYNLFDERVSMNLIKKLEKMDVKVYTSLNVSSDEAVKAIYELGEIQYWANELDLTGTAAHFMLNKKVDGIIALSAFGCGPDSLMVDEISYHAQERGVAMINLNIDEHTGEAGFMTRLEAFVDMLVRKKRKALMKRADCLKLVKPVQKEVQEQKEKTLA